MASALVRIGLIEVVPSRENSSPETQGQIGKTAAKRKMEKGDLFEARANDELSGVNSQNE
jgi:hypothetical protein